jgi:hypothetical protein
VQDRRINVSARGVAVALLSKSGSGKGDGRRAGPDKSHGQRSRKDTSIEDYLQSRISPARSSRRIYSSSAFDYVRHRHRLARPDWARVSGVETMNQRSQPPQPDRIRSIQGSFSWIDHRYLRQGFDQGLTRVEKLLYFVLIAVSNSEGVSFYSDERLWEILEIRHSHELDGARSELVARDLIAFKDGIYQVLALPNKRG